LALKFEKFLSGSLRLGRVLLERSHEGHFVLLGLEATMTHLGAGVDELELDLLKSLPLGVDQERLSQGENTLLGADAASLDHDKVLLDQAIVRKASHGVDGLVSQIVVRSSVVLDKLSILHMEPITDVVDLFVDLSTMVIALLTSTCDRVLDTARMPRADTSDLAKTLMSLAGELLGMPTGSHTLEAFALGDANDVNHLILDKDVLDGDFLLEVLAGKINFVSNRSTVELDFHDVRLLLASSQQLLLGVTNHTDSLTVLLDLVKIFLDLALAYFILPFRAGLGKSLLFALAPLFC